MGNQEQDIRDSVLESVLQKYCSRAHKGFGKYRQTLDRKDLSFLEWCVKALLITNLLTNI